MPNRNALTESDEYTTSSSATPQARPARQAQRISQLQHGVEITYRVHTQTQVLPSMTASDKSLGKTGVDGRREDYHNPNDKVEKKKNEDADRNWTSVI